MLTCWKFSGARANTTTTTVCTVEEGSTKTVQNCDADGLTRNRLKWPRVILPRIFQTGLNSACLELGPIGNTAAQRRQSARMGNQSAAAIGWPRSRGVGAERGGAERKMEELYDLRRIPALRTGSPPCIPPRCSAWLLARCYTTAAPLDRKVAPDADLAIASEPYHAGQVSRRAGTRTNWTRPARCPASDAVRIF